MSILHKLPGGTQLADWLGCLPNFHDAEVVGLDLRRSPELSTLRLHAWHTSDEIDGNGYFRRDRHVTVSFIFSGIIKLEISDWNHQNVLASLVVTEGAEGYDIALNSTFGVDGRIVLRPAERASAPREALSVLASFPFLTVTATNPKHSPILFSHLSIER